MSQQLVKPMTSKDLHLAIKKPDGIEYLMKRFAFASEEVLESAIRRVTPYKADAFLKELRKKRRKFTVVESADVSEVANESNLMAEEVQAVPYEVAAAVTMYNEEDEEKDVKPDMSLTLEEVRRDEQELSEKVRALESEHKQLVAQRSDYLARIDVAHREFNELRAQMAAKNAEVEELYSAYEACAAIMRELNSEKQFHQDLLAETRLRREALEKVTILVFADGSISVENAELPSVGEDELGKEFNRLLALPVPEDFTIKTVKNIARLHLMLTAFGEKAELMFDSSELERFWENVIAA